MRDPEGLRDVVRAEPFVEQIVFEPATAKGGQGLGDDVPSVHLSRVPLHDRLEVLDHRGPELGRVGLRDEIVGIEGARDPAVSFHFHVVLFGEGDQAVEAGEIEHALLRLHHVPLELVFRRDAVELGGEHVPVLLPGQIVRLPIIGGRLGRLHRAGADEDVRFLGELAERGIRVGCRGRGHDSGQRHPEGHGGENRGVS